MKNAKGLIAFAGHGEGPMELRWHQVGRVGHPVRYLHCPWSDCLRFPSGSSLLGANPVSNWQCPLYYHSCPQPELDIEIVKQYITNEERKESPLSNVLVVVLTGCFTFTDINGDFANKLINLGVKGIVGIKVFIGGYQIRAPRPGQDPLIALKIWDKLHEFIWKHLSHGATLRSAVEKAFEDFVDEVAEEGIRNELGILLWSGLSCGPTRKERLYLNLSNPYEPRLEYHDGRIVKWDDILKIAGDENTRIVDPEDEKVKKLRGKCGCVR